MTGAPAGLDPPAPHGKHAILERWTAVGFAVAAILGALAWTQPSVDGEDLWWHLAAGRAHQEAGELPRADPFSHTAAGAPWIDHSWLWGRVAWEAYRWHPDALAAFQLAVLAFALAAVAWGSRAASGSWAAACLVTWAVAATSHGFLDVRPNGITLLFTAFVLATIRSRYAPWLWPLLLCLWTNLHGGFLFGLGLIGAFALLRSAPEPVATTSHAGIAATWCGVAAAALAICLNPHGPAIYALPFQTLDPDTPFRALQEWQRTPLSLDPTNFAGRFTWMLLLSGTAVFARPRDPYAFAIAAVTAVMAFSARRFIPLFAIAAAPLVASGAVALAARVLDRVPDGRRRLLGGIGAVAALVAALGLWHDVRLTPRLLERWTQVASLPTGALAYLEGMSEPPRRLFTLYGWGGAVSFFAPSVPVFIDGRAGTVYPDDVAREYFRIAEVRSGWRRAFTDREIDAVLAERGAPLVRQLRAPPWGWQVAYLDPRSVLLLPPDAQADAIDAVSEPDRALARGFAALQRGREEAARALLEDAVAGDPLLLPAYGQLMRLSAMSGRDSDLREWTDTALAALPRRSDQIWLFAADAWGLRGNDEARLAALERVRADGPFDGEIRDMVESRREGPSPR